MTDYKVNITVDLQDLVDLLQEAEEIHVAARDAGTGSGAVFYAGTGVLYKLNQIVNLDELRRLTGRTKPEKCTV